MKKFLAIILLALALPLTAAAQTPAPSPAPSPTPAASPTPSPSPTPSSSDPYAYQRQGIFDCNQNGGYAMSVGALSATGGAYVPVSDNTTELNTGTYLYKECVLREVVDREREAAMAAFNKQAVLAVQQGRNGNPQYSVNENQELLEQVSDPIELAFLQDQSFWNTVNPSLRDSLKRANALYYEGETRAPQALSLKCPYTGDLPSVWSGSVPFDFTTFLNATQPQCDPVLANFFVQDYANGKISRGITYAQRQLDYGRGYYPKTDNNQNPLLAHVVTPAITVQSSFQTQIDSSVRQLENANDIGQMIGALYAGLSTQILSDQNGLSGLTTATGGKPSYLDQVVAESSKGVRDAAANNALTILANARQVESGFLQTVNAIASTLAQTIQSLRSAENQCWTLIIQKECKAPPDQNGICQAPDVCTSTPTTDPTTGQQTTTSSCVPGPTLKVATSTAFSAPVIASQIQPQASSTVADINSSRAALTLIDQLIRGIQNTASLDAQRLALQQLDSLVASHKLHVQPDLTAKSQQLTATQDTMQKLLSDTADAWRKSTDPATGWCNIDNQAVIDAWQKKWLKK